MPLSLSNRLVLSRLWWNARPLFISHGALDVILLFPSTCAIYLFAFLYIGIRKICNHKYHPGAPLLWGALILVLVNFIIKTYASSFTLICYICFYNAYELCAISLATYTPLADAWEREWVIPLPSPIT